MKLRFSLLMLVIVLFFSCSGEKKIKLIDKNFEDEIPVKALLSFTFNKDLMPDSIVGTWTETEYIHFEPAVEGKFHWQTKNTLVFTPADAFLPATNYTGKFTDEIFRYTKKLRFSGEKQIHFHTTYLDLISSRAYWHFSEENGGVHCIKIDLGFNYPVLPSEVGGLMKVMINDEDIQFDLLTEEIDDDISLASKNIQKEDKDYPVKIIIAEGLAPYNGREKTKEAFEEEFVIPSPFKLEITEVQANHDGTEGTITLYTTQQAAGENIKQYISIVPSVKYNVEVQSGYFTIQSEDFSMEEKYEINIKKGLQGTIGGELKYDYSQPISFGKVSPTIRFFDQKEFYVSGSGSRNIQVALINVPKVTVTITKIYENNIISYLKNNSYYYDYDYDYEYDYYYNYHDPENLGDIVYDEEIETSTLPRKGSNRILSLDFEDKLADHKGIYVLEIRSKEDYWLRASKMIAISDIGLIVKKGENKVTVFANSIRSAKPLASVTIRFIGRNNQVTHTTKTNAEGVAEYTFNELRASGFETFLVAAQLNSDYNVLPLNNTRINTSRFDVGGKYQNPSGFEAFVYGDRDLYRPGETVNISTIIRDSEWNTPGNIPLILKFITPNGKVYKTIKKVLNEYGSFETQIELSSSAQTGSYVANVFTSNNVLIGSKVIKVEEFMPDRIKVKVDLDKKEYKPGDKIHIDIEAVNFFGPPAANRNYEVELSIKQANFYPKKNAGYNYYIRGTHSAFQDILRQAKTDDEGKAIEEFDIPREYKNMGMLKADLFSTVFDETGRPVNRLLRTTIYTQDVFYGVKCEDYYVRTGLPVKYNLIAVDKNGNELSDVDARVELIRHEYKTVLSRSGGYFRYKSEKVEKVLQKKTIKINEKSTVFSFIPDISGNYELRISVPGVNTYVESDIYAYGWGSTRYSSFKVNNEGQIDIELDKETYNIGDKANVIMKTPFSGKILVTIETDEVVDYFYTQTDKRAASFSLDIKEEYLPGVYIGATLFRPHEESDIPLTVAHGYAPMKVDDPENKMSVNITAVEKSRSNSKQVIRVKSKPNSALTIAVVDEGILQVAGYATPDPYGYFYQRRALEVSSSNVYPYLFPEIGMVRSHTGGDGSEMEKRLNPMQNNRVKLVSFWSGIIKTNFRGEAEYKIDIPQFSGDLRIMAVAYNGKIFGSEQKNMKVADPLVISVALPRFLSPGDKVDVPVILTNTTDKETRCKTGIKLEGPLHVVGESTGTVSIPANTEAELLFKIEAQQQLGESSVRIEANALGEEFINKTDITVRPASPLQKRTGTGWVDAGKTKTLEINTNDFIEKSVDGYLILSKNPMIQYSQSLDYLVRYPYGCVEQTISSAFPQLYFGDLIGTMYSEEKALKDAVGNVQTALDRIKLMQLYNGGLTYWPGHGTESWWGSVYAAHFALEAKKAGYEVDESFLNYLLKYLKKKLEKKETVTYYYNTNKRKEIAPKEVAYSLYVLALAGEKPTALLNYYNSRTEQLSLDSKYLLAGAYALTGNMQKASEVLPRAFEGEEALHSFGGSFYSYIRDEAIALNVLLEIDSDNQQVGMMVKHISETLKNKRYLNTQERTFGFLAMGKFARSIAESNPKGVLKANGKPIASFENKDLKVTIAEIVSKKVELSIQGTGRLYYFWESEGISRDGSYLEEDKYIRVRRNFYDRNGNLITNNQFKQNDLVLIELSLTGLSAQYVENVAITDILPACFEIENPRLTTLPPGMNYPNSRSHPEYMDIRDDRINMFTTARSGTYYYYYLVRVVSTGTYQMGPVSADAMYNGEYHSYHGAGIIEVKKK